MAYTEPPDIASGDIWDRDDFQTYIVDNIVALKALISTGAASLTLTADDLVVGTSAGTLGTLDVDDGDLIIGTSGAVATLSVGENNEVLTASSDEVTWATIAAPTIDHILYFALGT